MTRKLVVQTVVAGVAAFVLMTGAAYLLGVKINDLFRCWQLMTIATALGFTAERIFGTEVSPLGVPHVILLAAGALALTTVPMPVHQGFMLWLLRFAQIFAPYFVGALISWLCAIVWEGFVRRAITMSTRF